MPLGIELILFNFTFFENSFIFEVVIINVG